jgi:hypothetical protein
MTELADKLEGLGRKDCFTMYTSGDSASGCPFSVACRKGGKDTLKGDPFGNLWAFSGKRHAVPAPANRLSRRCGHLPKGPAASAPLPLTGCLLRFNIK